MVENILVGELLLRRLCGFAVSYEELQSRLCTESTYEKKDYGVGIVEHKNKIFACSKTLLRAITMNALPMIVIYNSTVVMTRKYGQSTNNSRVVNYDQRAFIKLEQGCPNLDTRFLNCDST